MSANNIDLSKIHINYESILLKWDLDFVIPIHCGIFRKNFCLDFNEELKAKEDWIFWINYFEKKPRYKFINIKAALYRKHNNNMSNRQVSDKNKGIKGLFCTI